MPQLEWRGDTPLSRQFDDIYFQPQNGLAESRHVFLSGNNLTERWQDKDTFVIVELGFGTGLNFLATWQLWQDQPVRPNIHYYSIELYPLPKNDIERAHHVFPDIQSLSAQMTKNYPAIFDKDWHWQAEKDFNLTVLWGDAAGKIADIADKVDAWYLDGFTPANNPELWSENIFQMIADKSKSGTTLATFTVARAVRDHAEKAGFVLQKKKGFGRKRDMLTGYYNG